MGLEIAEERLGHLIDAREPDASPKLDREGSTNENPGRTSDDTGADLRSRAS